jgi:hypothetical protein
MRTHPARLVALDRTVIEEMAQAKLDEAHALIALLDRFDGDPDDEESDPSGQCDEDGVNTALHVLAERTAGCILSDNDHDEYAY